MSRTIHILLFTVISLQMSVANAMGKGGEGGNASHGGSPSTGGSTRSNSGTRSSNNHSPQDSSGRYGGGYDFNQVNKAPVGPQWPFNLIFKKRPKEPMEPRDRKPRPPVKPRRPVQVSKGNAMVDRTCDQRYPYLWTLKNQPMRFSISNTLNSLQGRGDADILHRCLVRDYRTMGLAGKMRTQVLVWRMKQRFALNRPTTVNPRPAYRPMYSTYQDSYYYNSTTSR